MRKLNGWMCLAIFVLVVIQSIHVYQFDTIADWTGLGIIIFMFICSFHAWRSYD